MRPVGSSSAGRLCPSVLVMPPSLFSGVIFGVSCFFGAFCCLVFGAPTAKHPQPHTRIRPPCLVCAPRWVLGLLVSGFRARHSLAASVCLAARLPAYLYIALDPRCVLSRPPSGGLLLSV